MNKKEYAKMSKKASPKSPTFKNCIWAFVIGGAICTAGQGIYDLYMLMDISEKDGRALTSITLVFLGIFFTSVRLYDKLAKHAGAGTLVPITGFANAIVSPAIEFKSEGLVLGLGAKLFTIAGPVIVYGIISSVVYGVILCIIQMF